jgi:hypothetical protein
MRDNPVWRESVEIFFTEGHGFAVYFYLLIIIAPVEFLPCIFRRSMLKGGAARRVFSR